MDTILSLVLTQLNLYQYSCPGLMLTSPPQAQLLSSWSACYQQSQGQAELAAQQVMLLEPAAAMAF